MSRALAKNMGHMAASNLKTTLRFSRRSETSVSKYSVTMATALQRLRQNHRQNEEVDLL
jgi:hypothetical protein